MQAYRLRHAVTFQAPIETVDPQTGAREITWQNAIVGGKAMIDYPAEVLTGPGRELMAAAADHAEITARINVPWFDITEQQLATWRILWDGRTYNIQGISTDVTARREWRLTC